MMTACIANADYEVIDRSPLSLQAGEQVRLGEPDPNWPGWTWVTATSGRGSHVPDTLLEDLGNGCARMTAAFQTCDLSVQRGQQLSILQEVNGWCWCRNTEGREGWLPDYLLKKVDA
jgi:hypothetical protein